MEGSAEVWEARKHIAWGNATVALFSFCAASLVFLLSYVGFGVEAEGDSLFAESRVVVLILLSLSIIQFGYFFLISKNKIRTSPESARRLLDTENTYFIAFAALASSLIYAVSRLGQISNGLSALAASFILAIFFVIQLAYLMIGDRLEKRK